jgi:prolyl 4-hydroxylase
MRTASIDPDLRHWIIDQARAGKSPESVLKPLLDRGWEKQRAIDAVEEIAREFVAEHARANDLPEPVRVPAPSTLNGPSVIRVAGRDVQVLASLLHPRVVVFGNLLSHAECDQLIRLSRERLVRSSVADTETGDDDIHEDRTSRGTYLGRGSNELCRRIESRIAALVEWPVENGEALQILCYGVGAQYKPHHDYFDPRHSGYQKILERGGQRVASLVMYLNTPRYGGATIFPEAKFEVAAIKGNAVFFSYDRPHPITRTLHGGAPIVEGEKWVATKWLRERPHL